MNTNALIKIILGAALLLVFWPSGYLTIPAAARWVLVIVAALFGIKLILDGLNGL